MRSENQTPHKTTLFLDLDNTLILALPIASANDTLDPPTTRADFSVRFRDPDGVWIRYAVFLRKGVREFLMRAAKSFELAIYTAAIRPYANPIIDALESGGTCRFSHRLYREHCELDSTTFPDKLIKRLSCIGDRSLTKCLLIDDNPVHLAENKGSCIPITPFIDPEKNDDELDTVAKTLFGGNTGTKLTAV